jgi:hypothetical protein
MKAKYVLLNMSLDINRFAEENPGLSGMIILVCSALMYVWFVQNYKPSGYIGERARDSAIIAIISFSIVAVFLIFKSFQNL